MKDGTCIEGCGTFPNVNCYYSRIFDGNTDIAAICDAVNNRIEQQEACFANTDANACIGMSGCDWVSGNIESGVAGNWCVLDLVRDIPEAICTASTCSDCLADDTCVWMKDDNICKNSCDDFPNVDCFYGPQFGAVQSADTTAKLCKVATEFTLQNERCFNNTDQDSCLAQTNTSCVWVLGADTSNGNGHCSYNLAAISDDNGDEEGGSSAATTSNGALYIFYGASAAVFSLGLIL